MNNIIEIIKGRKSVRSFKEKPLSTAHKENLMAFAKSIENPFGLPVEFMLLNSKESELKCPVVCGDALFIGGKIHKSDNANVAFGYSFQQLLLYAESLNIGSVWLGGTMNRQAFETAMELKSREIMPCAAALGYPADKMSLRESVMKKAIKSNERLPFEKLFYYGGCDTPLTKDLSGIFTTPLEMVRLAPSAVNRQPWRAVVTENAVHFYLKRSTEASGIDIQMVDMGIALCHFDLTAKELALKTTFKIDDPMLETKPNLEYVASYEI